MRIAILTTQCPFVIGGAELHARNLEGALRMAGHEAEIVTMPFKWYPPLTILDHMLAAQSMDVSEFNGVKIDLAVCLKFPAYLMRHPNKTFWILHQHRQAYDMWNNGLSDLFDDPNGQFVRAAIREADNAELGHASRIFANSSNVAKRLQHYNSIAAEPLYHPPPLADRLRGGEFGAYFYYPSRISPAKRQDFVLRSLAHSKSKARVVFSGAPDNPDYGLELKKLARDLGISDRVEWKGFVSDAEMLGLYAGARGVLFTPIDEDLGYIALEAMLAGKPLLTLSDAGEPADLVRDGIEGWILPPEHSAFADAMDRLASSVEMARTMGAAGLERYHSLDISWDNVVAKLTDVSAPALASYPMISAARASTSLVRAQAERVGGENRLSDVDWRIDQDAERGLSLAGIADRYAFDDHLAQHGSYYQTHWPRYQATLDAILRLKLKPRRILEIGTSEPYIFTALLKETFPDADVTVIQESPAGLRWRHQIECKQGRASNIDIDVYGLNVETTRLPFSDGKFDLIVAMEILEHFTIDPSFVFQEAQRVLCEGGAFLVTTPNLVSLQSISRALSGLSPYCFGIFVPWNGTYGRHNREYTPQEVESLGRYVGMDTALLDTADIYRQDDAPKALRDFMAEQGLPLNLRRQNIFYVGRKSANAKMGVRPSNLFSVDPQIFSGELQLARAADSYDGFIVRALNKSPLLWACEGTARIRLTVDRIDQNGLVTLDVMAFDLPRDVEPGGFVELPIRAATNEGVRGCWYEIGLHAQGAGPFKGAGRSQPVCLFAEWLELAPDLPLETDAA
jgi:glycosyltransferase involved in cell wall biosynthesis/SAM-dependent methyltransferase